MGHERTLLGSHAKQRALEQLLVNEAMTSDAVTITPAASLLTQRE